MDTTKIADEINQHRRRFFGAAADDRRRRSARHDRLCGSTTGKRSGRLPAIKPGTNTSFGPLKQIDAGVLNVGYAEAGPADGPRGHSSARLALRHSQLMSMSRRCWRRRATG